MIARRWAAGPLPWAAVPALWGAAFTLACRLAGTLPEPGADEAGLADLLFGESRHALSGALFEQADVFFHKGVEHFEKKAFTNTVFQALLTDIAPETHLHAEGQSAMEIIPWLRLATRADPHNVDACLVTSFWIMTQAHRPDLAEQVLLEAERNNPGDYRILLEKGRLFLRTLQFQRAANALDAALARWPGRLDPKDEQALLDKAEVYTYRAFLCELTGQPRAAADCFKKVLAIFPQRSYIKQRVELLESGREPPGGALKLLQGLYERPDHHVCTEEEEEHR